MYFSEHIIIGLVLSLTIWAITKNNSYAIVAFAGSILPDLIDKPIGYLFYASGRSVAHSIVIISIACIVALVIFKPYRKHVGLLYLTILIHHVTDWMWFPGWKALWLYPLYGDVIPRTGTIDVNGCINMMEWCYQTEMLHFNNYIMMVISGLTLFYILYYLWHAET